MSDSVYDQLLMRLSEAHPQPRLTAMRRVMELMGDPQHSAPVIHITGTNGKSSVSRMIESLVRAHGLRTGLFVSPHLVKFNERIMLDGEPIGSESLERAWAEVEPILMLVDEELRALAEPEVTFFEAITALAFNAFADAPVDVMILEVGMGGAWDATNVADATVAVFTPIDLDHTKQLGSTVTEIARTKAGIMKQGAFVVSAQQSSAVTEELRHAADDLSIQLRSQGSDFALTSHVLAVGGQVISVHGLFGEYRDLALPLHGLHQAENATLAIAATEAFLSDAQPLSIELLSDALASVRSPGRFERVSQTPLVFVDSAHNPHGVGALSRTVSSTFPDRECGILVGMLDDKDAATSAGILATLSSTFFVTQPNSPRAFSASDLAEIFSVAAPGADVRLHAELLPALEAVFAWANERDDRIVIVTGSVLLVGQVLEAMNQQKRSE